MDADRYTLAQRQDESATSVGSQRTLNPAQVPVAPLPWQMPARHARLWHQLPPAVAQPLPAAARPLQRRTACWQQPPSLPARLPAAAARLQQLLQGGHVGRGGLRLLMRRLQSQLHNLCSRSIGPGSTLQCGAGPELPEQHLCFRV